MIKSNPIVCSVCIANYNGCSTLKECIDSVINQNCDFNTEIVIHDDHSSDSSVDFIKKNYPHITLIENKNNVGFCKSNNNMVKIAKGQFVLLLNNDAALFPDALQSLYDFAKQQTKQGVLGLPQYNWQTNKLIDIGNNLDIFLNPVPNKQVKIQDVAQIIGACFWIPKILWSELEGFPDWFHTNAEDMYLSYYARLSGYPVIALNSSGFKHWVGKSLGGGKITNNKLSTSYNRRSLSERNKTYVMLLCYPISWLIVIFPLHLILLMIEGLILTIIKKETKIWKKIYGFCLIEVWRNRQKILKTRKVIQNKKATTNIKLFKMHQLIPHKLTLLLKYGLPKIQ